jgi:predicted GIY-YIG superfamily endonuclease
MVNHVLRHENNIAIDRMMDKEWKVYLAQSLRTRRYYVGMSPDPIERLKRHNTGNGAKFAVDQGPLQLVYVSQPFKDKSSARKREIQIKGWRAEKKKWLIEGKIK